MREVDGRGASLGGLGRVQDAKACCVHTVLSSGPASYAWFSQGPLLLVH